MIVAKDNDSASRSVQDDSFAVAAAEVLQWHSFVVIAFVLFLIIKGMNAAMKKKEEAPAPAPGPSNEEKLLMEIDLLGVWMDVPFVGAEGAGG